MPRAVLVLALMLAGCVSPAPSSPGAPSLAGDLALESAAFDDGAAIPREHTCDGANASPPLLVRRVPAEAVAVALLVYDPDAPTPQAPLRNITHWVIWDATPANGSVEFPEGGLPDGARQDAAYRGPCPPLGSTAHRYFFVATALDAPLGLADGSAREDVEREVAAHRIADVTLVGTYARALPVT